MNDNGNHRQLPPPAPDHLIPNEFRNGHTRQQKPPRAPFRAISAKAADLRNAVRHGNPIPAQPPKTSTFEARFERATNRDPSTARKL